MTDEQLKNVLQEFNKSLMTSSKNMVEASKSLKESSDSLGHSGLPSGGIKTKDFLRRKDPMDKLISEVDQLEEYAKANLDITKKKDKAIGKGLLGLLGGLGGLLGGLIAAGGLLGYLLTGKKEMLFSVAKGLMKYNPVGKFLMKISDDLIKGFAGLIFKGIKAASKLTGKAVAKTGIKSAGKVAGKVAGKLGIKSASKTLAKSAGKVAGKAAFKTLGKAALKKLPIVGSLAGLWFGIERFKSGDTLGGLLEIASGLTSLIPGAGIPLGLAIDAFLLFRDIKGKDAVDKGIGKAVGGFAKKTLTWKNMRHIPGLGVIAGFMEAKEKWSTDKWGAVQDIVTGVSSIVPGAGLIMDPIMGFIGNFVKSGGLEQVGTAVGGATVAVKNFTWETIKTIGIPGFKTIGYFMSGIEKFKTDPIGGFKDIAMGLVDLVPGGSFIVSNIIGLVDFFDKNPDTLKNSVNDAIQTTQKIFAAPVEGVKNLWKNFKASSFISGIKEGYSGSGSVASSAGASATGSGQGMLLNLSTPKDSTAPYSFDVSNLRVKGGTGTDSQAFAGGQVNPGILSFANMVQSNIGNDLNRFTGFNDIYHQEKAPRSSHAKGLAFDFTVANAKDSANISQKVKSLAQKYGTKVTVIDEYKNPSAKSTGGHIHVQVASNDEANKFINPVGGPTTSFTSSGNNLPRLNMPSSINKNSNEFSLTKESIDLLSQSIGKQFKQSMPDVKQQPRLISADTRS